jgi:hypothetical protein
MGNTIMENQYIFSGTSSDEIDDFIENDSNVREVVRKIIYFRNIYMNCYCKSQM